MDREPLDTKGTFMRKALFFVIIISIVCCTMCFAAQKREIDVKKVSIAFIIDTSRSMKDPLNGVPKIDIAKKTLLEILKMYKEENDKNHNIESALFYFPSDSYTRDFYVEKAVPLTSFDHKRLCVEVEKLACICGTPLGDAIRIADAELDKGKGIKFIVLLTDGENTYGPEPDAVYRKLQTANPTDYSELYVIAFNTDKRKFKPLQDLRATVYEAKDGEELLKIFIQNTQQILEMPDPSGNKSQLESGR